MKATSLETSSVVSSKDSLTSMINGITGCSGRHCLPFYQTLDKAKIENLKSLTHIAVASMTKKKMFTKLPLSKKILQLGNIDFYVGGA